MHGGGAMIETCTVNIITAANGQASLNMVEPFRAIP